MKYKIGDIVHLKDGTELEVCQASSVQDCSKCYFGKTNPNEKYPKIIPNFCTKPVKMGACCGFYRGEVLSMYFREINNKNNNNMEEKRNIQISLEEAKEWYNSSDSFKRELALKAYKKEELELSYFKILHKLPDDITRKNSIKRDMYVKLLNTAAYVNSIYPKEYCKDTKDYFQYVITTKGLCIDYSQPLFYKGFYINKTFVYYPETFIVTFNSEEAAKRAIDILGDELNMLFE